MNRLLIPSAALLAVLAGCAEQKAAQTVSLLDERTGITVAALPKPIELAPTEMLVMGKHPSFAYLGPVEWDQMGSVRTGLWLHLATGDDRPLADIRAGGAETLVLDGGRLILTPIDAPKLGKDPYKPAVPWGPTAYFALSDADLARLASSETLILESRAQDGSLITFKAGGNHRAALGAFMRANGATAD